MWRLAEQTRERMGERKRKYTGKRAVDQTIKYTTNLRGNSPGTLKQHAVLGVSEILARGLVPLSRGLNVHYKKSLCDASDGKKVLLSAPTLKIKYTVNKYSTNKTKK